MEGHGISFARPDFLSLLFIPGFLFLVWIYLFFKRRSCVKTYKHCREVPLREKFKFAGVLMFWLCLIVSSAFCVVALVRPQKIISVINKRSVDIIIVMDGSASMHVKDVDSDRWQRSTEFLEVLAETMNWDGDRIALTLFAYKASPQIRLTKDPNVFLFFLDHLGKNSPFLLEDNKTWYSNAEEGIYWGLKIIKKDEKLNGKNKNSKAFVVLSDGQELTGKIENSIKEARAINISVYVIGVGKESGGIIPKPPPKPPQQQYVYHPFLGVPIPNPQFSQEKEEEYKPTYSRLDRKSLMKIANMGKGRYFELNIESDKNIAAKIISDIQAKSGSDEKQEKFAELYWHFLLASAIFLIAGAYELAKK